MELVKLAQRDNSDIRGTHGSDGCHLDWPCAEVPKVGGNRVELYCRPGLITS
jgi:hypothetical protein